MEIVEIRRDERAELQRMIDKVVVCAWRLGASAGNFDVPDEAVTKNMKELMEARILLRTSVQHVGKLNGIDFDKAGAKVVFHTNELHFSITPAS